MVRGDVSEEKVVRAGEIGGGMGGEEGKGKGGEYKATRDSEQHTLELSLITTEKALKASDGGVRYRAKAHSEAGENG